MKTYPVGKRPRNGESIILCDGKDLIFVGLVKIDEDDGVKIFLCPDLECGYIEWRKLGKGYRWCYEEELSRAMVGGQK